MYKNVRVEQSYTGTWLVRADSQRFGENAIMYEDFDFNCAMNYAKRLEAGTI